jgi:hypothetical protein
MGLGRALLDCPLSAIAAIAAILRIAHRLGSEVAKLRFERLTVWLRKNVEFQRARPPALVRENVVGHALRAELRVAL